MTMKRILPAACVAALMSAGSAHAFLIDFTDYSAGAWPGPTGSGTTVSETTVNYNPAGIGAFSVTLQSRPADSLTFTAFDGTGDTSFCDPTGPLACDGDGVGVVNDEITTDPDATPRRQWITATFSRALKVTGLHFLDLFETDDESEKETALVFYNRTGGGGADDSIAADDEFGVDAGYTFASVDRDGIMSITFKARGTNDDVGEADYALAGINVVPLPAAGWLLVGAFGGLYGARRLKKKL